MRVTHAKAHRPSITAATYSLILTVLLGIPPHKLLAQQGRIPITIDNSRRITLPGHIHAGVLPANDQGRVAASLQLPYVTISLQPSAAQQSGLTALLQRQQDPSSPDFHRWLTPEQFADRFGLAQSDIGKITAWLQSQNLTVLSVARGRNAISFSGPVRSVESAFGTEIHSYLVNGEAHYANATNPSIPAAFSGVILAIHGLDDFKLKPLLRKRSSVALPTAAQPNYLNESVCGGECIAPADFATIYDVNPLYNSGINGTGQKLAIVGQTEINPNDISTFRAAFSLPTSLPTMIQVPNDAPNPAVSVGDLPEADLDLELSGAVARNATILYVYSNNVEDSVEYAIDQNLAPVVSMSYGQCEEPSSADGGATSADALMLQRYAQQANAQGITWLAAAGDSGAADCYGETGVPQSVIDSATVDYPGSIPEVTSMGGSQFNEGSGNYWSGSGSALSYIPEMVWNTSSTDGSPAAGGGGASIFFSKPSWQVANGVPNDGARDVPDISLSASDDHDPFIVYTSAYSTRAGFETSLPAAYGGTSVAAPSMAGIVTLLNQYLVQNGFQSQAGAGNINPRLYALQQSAGVVHDTATGNNIVNPCEGERHPTCTNTAVGFNAGPGYDQASGLGSIDAYNLVLAWHPGSTSRVSPTLTLTANPSSVAAAGSATLTATLNVSNGTAPTGTVTFSAGGTSLGTATISNSAASVSVNASALVTGANTITAVYSGDRDYNSATASTSITVTASVSSAPAITGVANAASFSTLPVYSPGMILYVSGSNLGPAVGLSAPSVPLPTTLGGVTATINGLAAPLYYVSSGIVNLQIPYTVSLSTSVTLVVSYNNQSASVSFPVSAAAPGIFYDTKTGDAIVTSYANPANPVNTESAAPGQTISIYLTGAGAVSPPVTAGSTPISGTTPAPTQSVSLNVGGTAVTPTFVGIPGWSVGVTQINFTVPQTAIAGSTEQIIVTVGNTASPPVNLPIQ
jgi:uncharacterized protein (TIGR03437 family)